MEFIKSSPLFHGFPKVNRMPFTQTEMYLVCVIFRDDFFGIIDCTNRAGKIFIITLFHVNSKKRATSRQMTEWNFARFCYQSIKFCLPSSLSICYYCHCYCHVKVCEILVVLCGSCQVHEVKIALLPVPFHLCVVSVFAWFVYHINSMSICLCPNLHYPHSKWLNKLR